MKRLEKLENLIKKYNMEPEDVMVINECTLMFNVATGAKKDVKGQHNTIIMPLAGKQDKDGKPIRRMGIFDKSVPSTEVDVKIMNGEVYNPNFLVIPTDCEGAEIFEERKPKEDEHKPEEKKEPDKRPPFPPTR